MGYGTYVLGGLIEGGLATGGAAAFPLKRRLEQAPHFFLVWQSGLGRTILEVRRSHEAPLEGGFCRDRQRESERVKEFFSCGQCWSGKGGFGGERRTAWRSA